MSGVSDEGSESVYANASEGHGDGLESSDGEETSPYATSGLGEAATAPNPEASGTDAHAGVRPVVHGVGFGQTLQERYAGGIIHARPAPVAVANKAQQGRLNKKEKVAIRKVLNAVLSDEDNKFFWRC